MESIIEKIIEIEEKAQKICEDAVYHKEHFAADLENEIEQMQKTIMERAQKRVNIICQVEQQHARETIERDEKEFRKQLENLEALYRDHRQQWEDNVFRAVLGD